MSSLDFDLDMQMDNLEQEWRQGYEAGVAARAAYQSLAAGATTDAELLHSGAPAAGARRGVDGEHHGENQDVSRAVCWDRTKAERGETSARNK